MADETDPRSPILREPSALAPGQRIEGYEIVRLLGAGGMGEVYMARDLRLDRFAAIKVVRPSTVDASGLLAEAQVMARLSHRNVVTIYEARVQGDRIYLAMELIDGTTLRGWMAQRRPWREVVRVFVEAGKGLAAAHAAGIVHRDFKPDNVLIGDDGRVCVTDFGLAGAVAAASGDDAGDDEASPAVAATQRFSAWVAGTPAYMSPEQHLRAALDERTDQFAFCVSLHEALFGERPFAGARLAEIRDDVLSGRPLKIPAGRGVPSWLTAIVQRGLSLDRDARFPSMAALVAELDRDRAGARRRVVVAGVLAVTGGLAVFGLVRRPAAAPTCDGGRARLAQVWSPAGAATVRDTLAATGRPFAGEIADRVVAGMDRYAGRWSAMHRDACEAALVRREQSATLFDLRMGCLERRLGGLDGLARELARAPDVRLLDRAVQAVAELDDLGRCADAAALTAAVPPPDDPAVRARVAAFRPRLDRAATLARAGIAKDALPVALTLVAEARTIPFAPTLAEALHHAERLEVHAGAKELAEVTLREALQVAARVRDDALVVALWSDLLGLVGSQTPRLAEALAMVPAAEIAVARAGDQPRERGRVLASVGRLYLASGRFADAEDAFRRSVPLFEGPPRDELALLGSVNNLGIALYRQGRLEAASDAFARAQDLSAGVFGSGNPRTASAIFNLGNIQYQRGRLHEAMESFRRALAVYETSLGPDNANCARVHNNLGAAYMKVGRLDESLASYGTSLAIKERTLGREHLDTLATTENLAQLHFLAGDVARARARSDETIALKEKTLGPEHIALAESLTTRGRIAAAEGRLAAALADETRGLAIAEKAVGAESDEAAAARQALAELALAQRQYDQALAQARQALAIREKLVGPEHRDVAAALATAAAALVALRRPHDALPLLERALAIRERAQGDPADRAAVRFAFARLLWDTSGDRTRAVALAQAARSDYAGQGARSRAALAAVDAWLKAH
jgi:tetratricopeptide (TPR) repeat protein/predicted Ser/Thr protein kinase